MKKYIMKKNLSTISSIVEVSKKIQDGRDIDKILMHAMTEMGELTEEVLIAKGLSYKDPGKDGVVGEAVDLLICVVDLLHLSLKQLGVNLDVDAFDDFINAVVKNKLNKWEEKSELIQGKNR